MKIHILAFYFLLLFPVLFTDTPRTTVSYQTEKVLPSNIIHVSYITNVYKNETELLHSYYTYPRFPANFQQAEKLNYFYLNKFFLDYNQLQNTIKNVDFLIFPPNTVYAYDHTYEIKFLSSHFLSILENTYIYSGGIHPESTYEAHTFSLENGEELKLESLFLLPKSEIKMKIENTIIDSLQEAPDDFYPNAIQIVRDMSLDSFHFYIGHDGINIFFNPYEIAPYTKGYVEFNIPT